jgi:hypothetical protein
MASQDNSNKEKMFWIDNFLGINQRQNWDAIPLNTSPLLQNISLDKIGSWSKRKGSDLLATTQAGTGVFGLHEYNPYNAPSKVRAIRSTDLDTYDFDTDTYTAIDPTNFTANTKIFSVDFLNKAYHISEADYLQYENGTTTTVVGTGGNEIKGRALAVAQNTLFVGNVTHIGGVGAVDQQDRVYYSFFNNETQTPDDQLYDNETGSNSMSTSTRWFTVLAPLRGLFPYGLSNSIHAFTGSKCYSFDVAMENNSTGPKWVFDIGLSNQRGITTCNGWMVWMDATGRFWGWNGSSAPNSLSFALEDDSKGEAIVSAIDKENIGDVCAGSLGNKFYFSIGNINYFGETINNALLVGFMMPDMSNVLWSLYSLPVRPTIFINATHDGERVLLFGTDDADDIYQLEVGTNDVGSTTTAVTGKAKTAFTDCNNPLYTKNGTEIWIKFRPQPVNNTYLKISYAVDGNFQYTSISDSDGGGETDGGVIDMYDAQYATKTDNIVRVKIPGGVRFRTISIQIENSQVSESFEVTGIGVMYTLQPLDITYTAS